MAIGLTFLKEAEGALVPMASPVAGPAADAARRVPMGVASRFRRLRLLRRLGRGECCGFARASEREVGIGWRHWRAEEVDLVIIFSKT